MKCEAVQYSDTMACMACKLTWNTNDPHPPACKANSLGVKPKESNPEMVVVYLFVSGLICFMVWLWWIFS